MSTSGNFIEYMHCQVEKINDEKLKFNRFDDDFVIEWIQFNSSIFREEWDNSLCKNCMTNNSCGKEVKKECTCFKEK